MARRFLSGKLARRSVFAVAVLLVVGGMLYLADSVADDLSNLESAQSDNQQWTITQTEVEFLEFTNVLAAVAIDQDLPLVDLRRRFDIFYSRITTLERARVYQVLKEDPTYLSQLTSLRAFLNEAVGVIDLPDDQARAELPTLVSLTEELRPTVRQLANRALMLFAELSEDRRTEFSQTLLKLALAVLLLLVALSLTVLYMRRLAIQASTGRIQAMQEASRTETVIETALDGVIVADLDGKILRFNAAAERIFGHTAEEVIGRDLGPLIVPDHMRDAHAAGMQRMRDGGERRVVGKGRVQLEAIRKGGEAFPVELAIQTAETDQGKVFIAFLRDVSASVRAEQALVEARDQALAADRLKTEFLATMSHEIRTPLNGLLGNLTLIQDTRLSPTQKRYVQNMSTSGDLLLRHVSDVLDLSRYDVDSLDLLQVPVNLSRLIQSIVDSQSGPAASNNTVIEWRWLDEPHDWVVSDPDALQHIFMNLVSNAVKFTRNGRVSISVDATKREDDAYDYIFHVSDTGQGISDELKARIFEDFVTGTVAYDRDVGGTGLGLGIVRRSVSALGGEIDVESEKGVGSTFEVRLTLEKTTAVEPSEVDHSGVATVPSLSILIVEDNEINRAVARELLARDGHKTIEANDGAAALEAAAKQRFDLILMDISMPVMDGRAATRAIRRGAGLNSETPILALTANAMKSEQDAFMTDGMNGIIMKPLSPQSLRSELQRVFGEEDDQSGQSDDLAHHNQMREVMSEHDYQALRARFVAQVEDLHKLITGHAPPELAHIAEESHKIAGSASVFGAMDYAEALRRIEHAAKRGDADAVKAGTKALPEKWEAATETF